MPKVSIILPNYNHAPFLPARIESILGQTFQDFDLLILDDCSPDNSREVASRYAGDPRVSCDFNLLNSGSPYKQWRKGLGLTNGEYVWIAESDDFAEPTLLARLVAQLDAHPRVGLAACDSLIIDADGRSLGVYSHSWRHIDAFADYELSVLDHEIVMDGRSYCSRYMNPWNTIPNASAVLFRRAALDAIGGPVTGMKLCGDWMTYCKMLMHCDMARIPEPLNHFRQHTVSVRNRTRSIDFVRESMTVQAYVAAELGLGDPLVHSTRVRDFFCQALIAAERGAPANKVPLARLPAVLGEAAEFGPAMFGRTLQILLKEQLATAAHAVGFKR